METEGQIPLVVIVEDDVSLLKAVERKFSASGFEAVPFTSGEEALEYLKETGSIPGLVWLDHHLPGMKGDEVLGEIRAQEKLKNVPVFVVTNTSTDEPYKEFLESSEKMRFFVKAEVTLDDAVTLAKQTLSS